ncbi:MAG: putative glycolipid-binding domain-containing protein [Candidatus Eiseniibacteriota bacterium]
MTSSLTGLRRTAAELSGRYLLLHHGVECGEERWRIEGAAAGIVVSGEQETVAPHPFPNHHAYRATLSDGWRINGLEVLWTVGARTLRATHAADGLMWRVRIEYGGQVREQEGDFPDYCEVDFATHLFNTLILARRDFQVGGEHEFPVLRVGPPLMAVTPDRMLYRCAEKHILDSPRGRVPAGRFVVTLPAHGDEDAYSFWADEDGIVLESYEGLDRSRPWMRLVEYRREGPSEASGRWAPR